MYAKPSVLTFRRAVHLNMSSERLTKESVGALKEQAGGQGLRIISRKPFKTQNVEIVCTGCSKRAGMSLPTNTPADELFLL